MLIKANYEPVFDENLSHKVDRAELCQCPLRVDFIRKVDKDELCLINL